MKAQNFVEMTASWFLWVLVAKNSKSSARSKVSGSSLGGLMIFVGWWAFEHKQQAKLTEWCPPGRCRCRRRERDGAIVEAGQQRNRRRSPVDLNRRRWSAVEQRQLAPAVSPSILPMGKTREWARYGPRTQLWLNSSFPFPLLVSFPTGSIYVFYGSKASISPATTVHYQSGMHKTTLSLKISLTKN